MVLWVFFLSKLFYTQAVVGLSENKFVKRISADEER